jgi:hypothetical protein
MAERRMFAKTIIGSDAFMDMPQSTQLLYFHLGMAGDDDGFVNKPKTIMRTIGSGDDDLRILAAKKFIIPFDSGVIVIKHWRIHNYIAKDRYSETKYKDEFRTLELDENRAYRLPATECIQPVYRCETQVRLGKDRIGEERKEEACFSTFSEEPEEQPAPEQSASTRLEKTRQYWNSKKGLPTYRYLAVSIPPEQRSDALRTMGAYTDPEIQQAIDCYASIINQSGKYKAFPTYLTLMGFLKGGVEAYGPDANALERCKLPSKPGEYVDPDRDEKWEKARIRAAQIEAEQGGSDDVEEEVSFDVGGMLSQLASKMTGGISHPEGAEA